MLYKNEKRNDISDDCNADQASQDDFWDIASLVPPKKEAPRTRLPQKIELTEIVADAPSASPKSEIDTNTAEIETTITRFIPPHGERKQPKPDEIYMPTGSLLKEVRIYHWQTKFQYYEEFCKMAEKLKDCHGSTCRFVPFFSYVPQYSQLSEGQLAWYLYWRDQVRSGNYPKTDYSYIMLYIYEIINLADSIDPTIGQAQLCALRDAYGKFYPRIASCLNEWICDYSLIHHLPPPSVIDAKTAETCSLKEFYIYSPDHPQEVLAKALMMFGTNYHYEKSKYASKDNISLYETHMQGAILACLRDEGEVGEKMEHLWGDKTTQTRDAYAGALCSHRVKRKIEVDFCSLARSHELRLILTDIMKYTENKLRAYWGVKSRLSLFGLPVSFRLCIDRYFEQNLPSKHAGQRKESDSVHEYDTLYDVPRKPLSLEHAAEIERDSWLTTAALVEAFDDEDKPGKPEAASSNVSSLKEQKGAKPLRFVEFSKETDNFEDKKNISEPLFTAQQDTDSNLTVTDSIADSGPSSSALREKIGVLFPFVLYAMNHDYAAEKDFCREIGKMPESVVDKINEISTEILGDIILCEAEGTDIPDAYNLVEEYASYITEL